MKKSEIIRLALVILGIILFFSTLLSVVEQIGFFSAFSEEASRNFTWLALQAVGLAFAFFISWYLVWKSSWMAEKLAGNVEDSAEADIVALDKTGTLHVAVVILCLFFIIKLFPSVLAAIYAVARAFIDDFGYFQDQYPDHIWTFLLYSALILVLVHSKKFTAWLLNKVIQN